MTVTVRLECEPENSARESPPPPKKCESEDSARELPPTPKKCEPEDSARESPPPPKKYKSHLPKLKLKVYRELQTRSSTKFQLIR